LDERPIEAQAPKVDLGKQTQQLDKKVAKCKVGVAWVNLLMMENPMTFGKYNNRLEKDVERVKLIGSFKASGIVSMREMSAIPIMIAVGRLKSGLTLVQDFSDPDMVPQLELQDVDAIMVASGQHRVSALKQYHKGLEEELTALEGRCVKISESPKALMQETIEEYEGLWVEIGMLKGQLDGMGKWGVIVYDESKW
jgi:hypothetical protein